MFNSKFDKNNKIFELSDNHQLYLLRKREKANNYLALSWKKRVL